MAASSPVCNELLEALDATREALEHHVVCDTCCAGERRRLHPSEARKGCAEFGAMDKRANALTYRAYASVVREETV